MTVARETDAGRILWWCPGCECAHTVPVKQLAQPIGAEAHGRMPADGWDWNGSLEAPTLAPSVLVYSRQTLIDHDLPHGDGPGQLLAPENKTMTPRCHTFIRNGLIEFLADCTHALAGRTVPMEDLDTREAATRRGEQL